MVVLKTFEEVYRNVVQTLPDIQAGLVSKQEQDTGVFITTPLSILVKGVQLLFPYGEPEHNVFCTKLRNKGVVLFSPVVAVTSISRIRAILNRAA